MPGASRIASKRQERPSRSNTMAPGEVICSVIPKIIAGSHRQAHAYRRQRVPRNKMRTEPERVHPSRPRVKLAVMETWGIKVTRSLAQLGKLLRSVLQ